MKRAAPILSVLLFLCSGALGAWGYSQASEVSRLRAAAIAQRANAGIQATKCAAEVQDLKTSVAACETVLTAPAADPLKDCPADDPNAPVVPLGASVRGGLHVTVRNRTTKTADAVKLVFELYDGFGEPVERRFGDVRGNRVRTNKNATIPPGEERSLCCWNLDDFPGSTARAEPTLIAVHFTDGTSWHGCAKTPPPPPPALKPPPKPPGPPKPKEKCDPDSLVWPAVCPD